MAIINGTNFNDNDTFQAVPFFPFIQFFSRLDGTSSADSIFGLGGNDILNGFNGNDLLDGGTGVDTMNGGDGNDTYIVDNVGDLITGEIDDSIGGTADLVNASVTYTLVAAMENLTLTGAAAINGTGNAKNNVINGNGANNTLDGGAGADTMNGGDGNDTYIVDNIGDLISGEFDDALGGTADLVNASVTYSLVAAMENLTLTGAAAINGTGNAKNNVINGNGANNTLNGLAGNDTINGGSGSDTYFGGDGNDVLTDVFSSQSDVLDGGAGADTNERW